MLSMLAVNTCQEETLRRLTGKKVISSWDLNIIIEGLSDITFFK
jgi:hypothetical protein